VITFNEYIKGNDMWLKINDEILSYSEYMLSEAIRPRPINYGTDFKNKQWKDVGKGFYITYFKTTEYVYTYVFKDGFVGFYASELTDEELVLSQNSITEIFNDPKIFKRKDTSLFIRVFNYFFYITLSAVDVFNSNHIYFDGNDKSLGELYIYISKNKSFLDVIDSLGFKYIGKQEINNRMFFTFKRK